MNINIKKENGNIIRGKLFESQDPKNQPLVIVSHGFGGCYKDIEHHGRTFAENGISAMFFDFCGGGARSTSDGDMVDMTVLSERDDLLCVLQYCKSCKDIKYTDIYLLGESQGGFVSLLAACKSPDVKGLILWYPAFVIPVDSQKRLEANDESSVNVMGNTISMKFNEIAAAINIEDYQREYEKPVLLIHGDKDEIVDISYSQKALKNFKNAELIVVENAGHGFIYPDNYRAAMSSVEFIKMNN